VDERFLLWLAGQHTAATAPTTLERAALVPVLAQLLRQTAPEASLLRTCLFSDRAVTELHDDLLLRSVPAHKVDGGLGLLRAMGLELTQLAQRGCQLVLLASDDERLIPYIDEVQWRGMRVVLLTDESSTDVARLMADDPSWARLLQQADRRVPLQAAAWQALTTPGVPVVWNEPIPARESVREPLLALGIEADAPPDDHWRSQVDRVIREWWEEETPQARLDLYEEMQDNQGVPPEADRHLLLRVRRELARPLNFPEKKAMREMIRAVVLAQPPVIDATATP